MELVCRIQGRALNQQDLAQIRDLLSAHPQWSRNQLDIELARTWNWRTAAGQLKTMAAHSLLLKLEQRGWITLPPRRRPASRRLPIAADLPLQERVDCSISVGLRELTPLTLDIVAAGHPDFARYLARHHYLGYRGPVGENLAYLARDRHGRDVAGLLFGAAAWKAAPRDRFIGWSDDGRAERVNWITNNTRFLILPWVQVPHLASHILALALRRPSRPSRRPRPNPRRPARSPRSSRTPSRDAPSREARLPKALPGPRSNPRAWPRPAGTCWPRSWTSWGRAAPPR